MRQVRGNREDKYPDCSASPVEPSAKLLEGSMVIAFTMEYLGPILNPTPFTAGHRLTVHYCT